MDASQASEVAAHLAECESVTSAQRVQIASETNEVRHEDWEDDGFDPEADARFEVEFVHADLSAGGLVPSEVVAVLSEHDLGVYVAGSEWQRTRTDA